MTEENIFNQETPEVPPAIPATTTTSPEVSDLVGAGKKYATTEAALASIPHAQKHILTLEQENANIKAELEKRKTTEQLLEEIKASTTPQAQTTASSGLDQNTVQQLIAQTLEQNESRRKAQVNIQTVTASFKEKYGDKAEEVYIAIAEESGLSVQNLNSLAASSPSAVLKLAGLENKQTNVSKINGTINTQTLSNTNNTTPLSARVKSGASTKDLVDAWKTAGKKVGRTYN